MKTQSPKPIVPERTLPSESLTLKNWWHLLARHTSALDPNESIGTALKIMVHRGFRHLPIVERDYGGAGNEILGIVSASDLIEFIDSGAMASWLDDSVTTIMHDNPISISSEDTILDAIRTISEKNVGALLIRRADEERERMRSMSGVGKLQGIVTLRDIVSVMAAYVPLGLPVEDYMTHDVATIGALDPVSSAVSIMSEWKVRRLPVVSKNKRIEGMVTNKAILRYVESVVAYNTMDIHSALGAPVMSTMIARMPLIDPKEDCGNALYFMRELGTGGFAVIDSQGIVGVITERDLVKRIYDKKGLSFFSELFLQDKRTILA